MENDGSEPTSQGYVNQDGPEYTPEQEAELEAAAQVDPALQPIVEVVKTAEENLAIMHSCGARALGMLESLNNFNYIPEHLKAQAHQIFADYYKAAPKVVE